MSQTFEQLSTGSEPNSSEQKTAEIIDIYPQPEEKAPEGKASEMWTDNKSEVAARAENLLDEIKHLHVPDEIKNPKPEGATEEAHAAIANLKHLKTSTQEIPPRPAPIDKPATTSLYRGLMESLVGNSWGKLRLKTTSWMLSRAESKSAKLDKKVGDMSAEITKAKEQLAKIPTTKTAKRERWQKTIDKLSGKHEGLVSQLVARENIRETYRQKLDHIGETMIDRLQTKMLPWKEEKNRWQAVDTRMTAAIGQYESKIESLRKEMADVKELKRGSKGEVKATYKEDIKELKRELAAAEARLFKIRDLQAVAASRFENYKYLVDPVEEKINNLRGTLSRENKTVENAAPSARVVEQSVEYRGRFSPALYIKMWNKICESSHRLKLSIDVNKLSRDMNLGEKPLNTDELAEAVRAYMLRKKIQDPAIDEVIKKTAKRLESYE